MLFDQEFIDLLEANPIEGISLACKKVQDTLEPLSNSQDWSEEEHEVLWEGASFINLAINANGLDVDADLPEATESMENNCISLFSYIESVIDSLEVDRLSLKIESYQNRYQSAFKNTFAYEFSQGDLDRIQILLNEIREQITANEQLEDSHKQRLLSKLEKLQSELHKRVSDLDRFWGLVGDAGVVLGKLGSDAKPIVDRLKEIAQITWKTQARTEELPSDSSNPVIEHDTNS